ncbi:MAG: pseudouridylate synthase [Prevotella sp.]|nr:pseudouridylate synthase [Prevotella sp.]
MTAIDYNNPGEDFLRTIDIHTLLPQQEPFVMVGRLTHYDDSGVETETDIAPDNIFVDNGAFSTTGLIENIAQTCAARIGYVNKYILKKGVQIGVIGAVRKLRVNGHPKAGDTIVTKMSIIEELLGMTLAMATVSLGDDLLVSTQIKLAVKNQDE